MTYVLASVDPAANRIFFWRAQGEVPMSQGMVIIKNPRFTDEHVVEGELITEEMRPPRGKRVYSDDEKWTDAEGNIIETAGIAVLNRKGVFFSND
jgi:hypothetical protein